MLWLLAVTGLFALSRFKHEYYALPAFPALAVLAGAAWAASRSDDGLAVGIRDRHIPRAQGTVAESVSQVPPLAG